MAIFRIFLNIIQAYIFLVGAVIALLVTFWWLIPSHIQKQLHFPFQAGFWLFMMYIWALNRLPTQGRLLFRQNTFRFIHAPVLLIATVGFGLGFLFN
ncbi:hypothetical protein ACLIKD_04325 [Azonexus sp. IMCC34842]|uniref:hypothetical protein n=1 Tax=Azonexus sp. IMCC34842 TaxID=3420950 RepID=UPI003D0EF62B